MSNGGDKVLAERRPRTDRDCGEVAVLFCDGCGMEIRHGRAVLRRLLNDVLTICFDYDDQNGSEELIEGTLQINATMLV